MNKLIFVLLFFFLIITNSQSQEQKKFNVEHLIEKHLVEADSLFNTQDYGLALPVYIKIDSLSKQNSFENLSTIKALLKRSAISKLTFTRESTNLAYDIVREALERAMAINSQKAIHLVYAYLADLTQMIRDYEKSKTYADLALSYYLKTKNDKLVSRMYLIKSVYYLESDSAHIEKADAARYKAIAYLKDKNNDYEMAKAKYYYGHFLRYNRKQFNKAISFLEDSRLLHEKVDRNEEELYHRCLRDLAICYDEIGNFKKSKTYYKKAYHLKIELNKRANRNTSRRLETQFQAENKEQKIALLKSENELINQQRKTQRNTFIAGFILVVIAGAFLFVLYQNRKKTADKLKELDSAKSKFFSNISHEFRTPLTLISNPIEEVIDDETFPENKKESFKMAKRNVNRLLALVNQLLDLSKIEANQLQLKIQKDNPIQIIAALVNAFKYSAEQKGINYSITIDNSNTEVFFDKDAIEKIVVNLLSNAVKYTPEKGRIYCSVNIQNETLFFQVKNTGVGLTSSEQKNVFQRFYQTSEDNIGSGIGLALVKELVDLHKGKITVHSVPNESTEFKVNLSVARESFKNETFINAKILDKEIAINTEAIVQEEDGVFIENNQPILLIVEDNADLRTLLKNSFEDTYNILTASNGQEGIDLALEHIPDIIISDIMMPIKDGITLTKSLKNNELTSHIPIILLTAKAGDVNEIEGIEIGGDDYITKPFNSKLLKTKVSNLIDIRSKLHSRYSQEIILTPKDIAVTNLDEQFLKKVQQILEEKLIESSFNIEDFSKAVGMSRMQLHRKIKALTGLSASEFVRSQRLKLASELLKTSDINISQVGYSVGFNDHSYFTKCFKEAYKCTPTDYANMHSKK